MASSASESEIDAALVGSEPDVLPEVRRLAEDYATRVISSMSCRTRAIARRSRTSLRKSKSAGSSALRSCVRSHVVGRA